MFFPLKGSPFAKSFFHISFLTLRGWVPVKPDHASFQNLCIMSLALLLKSRDDAVVWRGPKKSLMIQQFLCNVVWGNLDFLIIDTPPGTSDEHISLVEYLNTIKVDSKVVPRSAVLVTTPQAVSITDVQKEITFCQNVSLSIDGLFENMSGFYCPNCSECTNIFGSGGGKCLAEQQKIQFLGSLPIDPRINSYLSSKGNFFDAYLSTLKHCNDSNISSLVALEKYVNSIALNFNVQEIE